MRNTLARSLNSSHDFHPHTIFIEFNLKRRRKRGRSCLLGRGKQPCFRTSQRFPSTALNLITSARSRTEPSGRVPRKIRGGIRDLIGYPCCIIYSPHIVIAIGRTVFLSSVPTRLTSWRKNLIEDIPSTNTNKELNETATSHDVTIP